MHESTILINGRFQMRYVFDNLEDFEKHKSLLSPSLIDEFNRNYQALTLNNATQQNADCAVNPQQEQNDNPSEPSDDTPLDTLSESSDDTSLATYLGEQKLDEDIVSIIRSPGKPETSNASPVVPVLLRLTCISGHRMLRGKTHYHFVFPIPDFPYPQQWKNFIPSTTLGKRTKIANRQVYAGEAHDIAELKMEDVQVDMKAMMKAVYSDPQMIIGQHARLEEVVFFTEHNQCGIDPGMTLAEVTRKFLDSNPPPGMPLVFSPVVPENPRGKMWVPGGGETKRNQGGEPPRKESADKGLSTAGTEPPDGDQRLEGGQKHEKTSTDCAPTAILMVPTALTPINGGEQNQGTSKDDQIPKPEDSRIILVTSLAVTPPKKRSLDEDHWHNDQSPKRSKHKNQATRPDTKETHDRTNPFKSRIAYPRRRYSIPKTMVAGRYEQDEKKRNIDDFAPETPRANEKRVKRKANWGEDKSAKRGKHGIPNSVQTGILPRSQADARGTTDLSSVKRYYGQDAAKGQPVF